MDIITTTQAATLCLIVARLAVEFWLDYLNRQHVQAHADAVPDAFRGVIDPETYAKSVRYTLAKGRFGCVEYIVDAVLLATVLFSGALPWSFDLLTRWLGESAWASGLFLFALGIALSLARLPLDWYAQFRLEERFGFNTTTLKLWWSDRLKGFLMALALGYPLLLLVLKLVDWTGEQWWVWAWGSVLGFQLLMVVLAPVLILPLFNKFTPLPEGPLRERLRTLGDRTAFPSRDIQVMDGSKRSRHSNARSSPALAVSERLRCSIR